MDKKDSLNKMKVGHLNFFGSFGWRQDYSRKIKSEKT